jgi:hypothetical protein
MDNAAKTGMGVHPAVISVHHQMILLRRALDQGKVTVAWGDTGWKLLASPIFQIGFYFDVMRAFKTVCGRHILQSKRMRGQADAVERDTGLASMQPESGTHFAQRPRRYRIPAGHDAPG